MAAPPSFLQSLPTETDATDGDIVTFQVKVSNDPDDPTVISWWRCGEPLRPTPNRRDIISHEDDWHELILSNITEDDEGEYECRAENNRGHNSCFGSLYYYREGGGGTLTDVTMEGTGAEGDGRQSGLLILIDDGSQTEESGSEKSNRKSMTVSEQMQGIIEDLTQSSQGEITGSMTLEKDDDDQFNSDIDDLNDDDLENNLIQDILGMGAHKTVSEDTLVPEMPSPDLVVDVAVSEGATDPYGPSASTMRPHKWSSNPNHVQRKKKSKNAKEQKEEAIWPPEASLVTFDIPADTVTTSVELPFAKVTSTEDEEAIKSSGRCAGVETPFDVADITEEAVDAGSLHGTPTDGASMEQAAAGLEFKTVAFQETSLPHVDSRIPSGIDRDSSLTSVTDFSAAAIPSEGCQVSNRMSFVKSSVKSATFKQTDDGVMSTTTSSITSRVSSATMDSSSVAVHHQSTKLTRTAGEREEEDSVSVSYAAKKSKISSAYEADESSASINRSAVYSDSFITEVAAEHKGIDVYVAIMDFKPMESDDEAVPMKEGQQVEVIDASKPRRWLVRVIPMAGDEPSKEGWVPACYLEKSTAYDTLGSYIVTEAELDPKEMEAMQNREAIVKELVETEEDFAKDMQFVVENYYKQMDNPRLPKEFRDRKGSIFGNFKDISDFHNNVLMEGIHYHAKEPTKLGKTFLRLERDFDMHANYCWNEARAQQLLREGPLREFFDDHSRMIDDDKLLEDHLKLPIQRLNDYQLLLKELIKYSSRLNEDTADLQKALDFIHSINKRTKDLQYIQAIQGCNGDLLKLGKIIRHEIFDVVEENQTSASERYVFLFKGRIFVTERQLVSGKESYHVTNLFKLQDVEVIENVDGQPTSILFRSHKKNRPGFPLLFRAKSIEQKTNWCLDIASANQAVEDFGDLEPSIERPIEPIDTDHLELKHKAEERGEEPEFKKPKVESLKQQESVKKKQPKSGDSVPQTPTEDDSKPPFARQESVKKKSKSEDASAPQTPTDTDKPHKLSRQESVKKKPKSAESSAPQTPTESTTAPPLSRQESIKKKPKSAESSVPQTPTEEVTAPQLSRQDSEKKQKKSSVADKDIKPKEAVPEEVPPKVTRQDSSSKKEKKPSISEKGKGEPEVQTESKVKRQDSSDKKVPENTTKQPVKRQDSGKDKPSDTKEKKRGEDLIPKITMSEDASGSDARVESIDFGEDNATLASESLRSDDSVTPPASGAYEKPSFPLPSVYCHLLILIPVLSVFYVCTHILGIGFWE